MTNYSADYEDYWHGETQGHLLPDRGKRPGYSWIMRKVARLSKENKLKLFKTLGKQLNYDVEP